MAAYRSRICFWLLSGSFVRRISGQAISGLPLSMKSNSMPILIYRVVSACGTLGYGYPRESLRAALRGGVNAIICDAGSIDAGPYYLGAGTDYFEHDAVKADYRHMVE